MQTDIQTEASEENVAVSAESGARSMGSLGPIAIQYKTDEPCEHPAENLTKTNATLYPRENISIV